MSPQVLPKAEALSTLASMLVGKSVKATTGAALPPASIRGLATYIDADKKIVFAVAADLPFIASIGAALAMIPAGIVDEAIRAGKPSDALVENAYEALNVAAALFNDIPGATVHVKLDTLAIGLPTPEVGKRLLKPIARADLDVGIPGYPTGKICIMAVAKA